MIVKDVVFFKSDDENYYVEESGYKSNTIRFVDPEEDTQIRESDLLFIHITNTESDESFMRMIRDYRSYKDEQSRMCWIFSW